MENVLEEIDNNRKPLRWGYPLLLWCITIAGTPVLMVVWNIFNGTWTDDGWELASVTLFIFFGIFFSVPAFIFFLVIFHTLRYSSLATGFLKLILVAAAIIGMWVTLRLIGGSMITQLQWFYCVVILIAGVSLSLRPS